jgi:hypothetical protein
MTTEYATPRHHRCSRRRRMPVLGLVCRGCGGREMRIVVSGETGY